MATIPKLIECNALVRIEVELEGRELPWRHLVGTPRFIKWLADVLPELQSSSIGCEITPLEQIDALFAEFITGRPLNHGRQFSCLRPADRAVWELKTVDIRVFGWFAHRDCYVAVRGDHADRVKDHDLYAGYRDEVVRLRDQLDLDEPKYAPGDSADDVVSIADNWKK